MRLPILGPLLLGLLLFSPSLALTADLVDPGQRPLAPEPFATPVAFSDLGQEIHRGVEAQVRLEPQPGSSAPLADGERYLISVVFIEAATGTELLEGEVAARTFRTPEKRIETVRLIPGQTEWTGLLLLPTTGETLIKIGTRFADGKKRIYRFFYGQQPVGPSEDPSEPSDRRG